MSLNSLQARTIKPGDARCQPNRKEVGSPAPGCTQGAGQALGGLPCGGPGQRAPRVHQHTPAVASGLVALHWLVEPPGGALRDDDALTGILPGLF